MVKALCVAASFLMAPGSDEPPFNGIVPGEEIVVPIEIGPGEGKGEAHCHPPALKLKVTVEIEWRRP